MKKVMAFGEWIANCFIVYGDGEVFPLGILQSGVVN